MKKRKLEIPDSDMSEIWPQLSTGSVSSLSVSSPDSSSNGNIFALYSRIY